MVIFKALEDDSGIYKCQAENEYGTDTKLFRLIVQIPPTINYTQATNEGLTLQGLNIFFNLQLPKVFFRKFSIKFCSVQLDKDMESESRVGSQVMFGVKKLGVKNFALICPTPNSLEMSHFWVKNRIMKTKSTRLFLELNFSAFLGRCFSLS